MERRKFIKSAGVLITAFMVSSKVNILQASELIVSKISEYRKRILTIIEELKKEGSNLVRKVMNNKEFIFDPFNHYPYDGGIKDEQTGFQMFFHAHRENEYGHFHTFATDEDGELVHLVLISMNEMGELIGLATVNRWVTGDKYVKADRLKHLMKDFFINPTLYKDKRVVEFVNLIFKAYQNEIQTLFEQRDEWIKNYAFTYYREPFEDREHEILSSKEIFLKSSEL